jgi:hypothetical protein
MKKRMLIGTLLLGVLAFAVAGWTVDGVRWATGSSRRRRARLAPVAA